MSNLVDSYRMRAAWAHRTYGVRRAERDAEVMENIVEAGDNVEWIERAIYTLFPHQIRAMTS